MRDRAQAARRALCPALWWWTPPKLWRPSMPYGAAFTLGERSGGVGAGGTAATPRDSCQPGGGIPSCARLDIAPLRIQCGGFFWGGRIRRAALRGCSGVAAVVDGRNDAHFRTGQTWVRENAAATGRRPLLQPPPPCPGRAHTRAPCLL